MDPVDGSHTTHPDSEHQVAPQSEEDGDFDEAAHVVEYGDSPEAIARYDNPDSLTVVAAHAHMSVTGFNIAPSYTPSSSLASSSTAFTDSTPPDPPSLNIAPFDASSSSITLVNYNIDAPDNIYNNALSRAFSPSIVSHRTSLSRIAPTAFSLTSSPSDAQVGPSRAVSLDNAPSETFSFSFSYSSGSGSSSSSNSGIVSYHISRSRYAQSDTFSPSVAPSRSVSPIVTPPRTVSPIATPPRAASPTTTLYDYSGYALAQRAPLGRTRNRRAEYGAALIRNALSSYFSIRVAPPSLDITSNTSIAAPTAASDSSSATSSRAVSPGTTQSDNSSPSATSSRFVSPSVAPSRSVSPSVALVSPSRTASSDSSPRPRKRQKLDSQEDSGSEQSSNSEDDTCYWSLSELADKMSELVKPFIILNLDMLPILFKLVTGDELTSSGVCPLELGLLLQNVGGFRRWPLNFRKMDGTIRIREGPEYTRMRRIFQEQLGLPNEAVVPGPRLFLTLATFVFMEMSQLSGSILHTLLYDIARHDLGMVQVVTEHFCGQTSSNGFCKLVKKWVGELCRRVNAGTETHELLGMAAECLHNYRTECQNAGYTDINGDKDGEIAKRMLAGDVFHSRLLLGIFPDGLKEFLRVLPCLAPGELSDDAIERLRLI
ncbi:hypothetical protein GGI01_002934 [Coemansia sp. RSA 376]|nr:hypothetical protein H4S03_001407 [Coemansia sp. S3946]KAJ2066494.1 hypothetical protein GGH13_005696 [Coemansia sp. S155-1]KAJ2260535.1 hypothetical protein GGI01_002934 [Coemansia sp. RSA 376]KAJ2346073.1 hypothetical protein GGH92_003765 [Coemansia sp. RSA 2673]